MCGCPQSYRDMTSLWNINKGGNMDFFSRVINRSIQHERDIDGYEIYVVKHTPFIISKLRQFHTGTYIQRFYLACTEISQ